jgi:antitoxin FitA
MDPILLFGAKMPNLSIKDVPEQWAEALRLRAARNHRSLQGELMAILEAALQASSQQATPNTHLANAFATHLPTGQIAQIEGSTHRSTRHGWKTVEQVVADMNARFPNPVMGQPLAVDIIRAERDAR